MPTFVHLGLCLGLAVPTLIATSGPPQVGRVVLPVIQRTAERADHDLGVCTVDTRSAEFGVSVRVRTSTPTGPGGEYDQAFALAAADLPLRAGWAVRHEGMGLVDALSYDGSELRFEVRATEGLRHATVYEFAVDANLGAVRGVRISESEVGPVAPAIIECESALN